MKNKGFDCSSNIKRFFSLIIAAVLVITALTGTAVFAAPDKHYTEGRVVRVAFFPLNGYNEFNEAGEFDGMNVRFMDHVKVYTGWDIQYVLCNNWQDALVKLDNHEVDLVGSAQRSPEREPQYIFTDFTCGYTFGVIATAPDSMVAYEDFEAMKNMTFGTTKDYVRKSDFYAYLREHGIPESNVIEYDSSVQMKEALARGEVDAIAHTYMILEDNHRIIDQFDCMPFFYMSYPGNEAMMREFNDAIVDLSLNNPDLVKDLTYKFYADRFAKNLVLTQEEHDFIANTEVLNVGYFDNFFPYSYSKNLEFAGLVRTLLDQMSEDLDIKFNYVKFSSVSAAEQALRSGAIDFISYYPVSQSTEEKDIGLTISSPYSQVPLVTVAKSNASYDSNSNCAVTEWIKNESSKGLMLPGDMEITEYSDVESCLEAVKSDYASIAVCDAYMTEYLLGSRLKYRDLHIRTIADESYNACMAVSYSADPCLISLIDKTLVAITDEDLSKYMLEAETYTMNVFLSDNSLMIMALLLIVIMILLTSIFYMVKHRRQVHNLVYNDKELGIWNSNYVLRLLDNAHKYSYVGDYCIVVIRIDQFHMYEGVFGKNSGLKLLGCAVDVLRETSLSSNEAYARHRGSSLMLLLKKDERAALLMRLNEIRAAIEEHIIATTESDIKIAMGLCFISDTDDDPELALTYANTAAESASGSDGDNWIHVYDDQTRQKLIGDMARSRLLDSADINKDFISYYQPKTDIRTGEIVGAEALVRFMDPSADGAIRAPFFFIEYYEQNGRITELDFFVLESACRLLRNRIDQGLKVVPISCNFSRLHFMQPNFPGKFMDVLNRYRIPKWLIEVEITETIVVGELLHDMVLQNIRDLTEKGINFSIDDFGAGYSSLGVFEEMPATTIKLDRSFMLSKTDKKRQSAIMRGIVNLAESLHTEVVCEGVETDEDVELMRQIGAHVAQGYRYSKPVPPGEFEEMLNNIYIESFKAES